jgi:tetratricopeptide (TPR) repeat protein
MSPVLTRVVARIRLGYCLPVVLSLLLLHSTFGSDDPAATLTREFQAAKTSLAAQDLAGAEQHYRSTIAIGLRQIGNLSLSENNFDVATNYLDEAVSLTPDDNGLQVEAAVAWFRKGDPKKAKSMIEVVLQRDPGMARAHNVLGRLLLFEGSAKAAVSELKAAVDLHDDLETSYFLAIALLKTKQQADAAQVFQKLQATMGDSAALHVLFGRAYLVTHYPGPAMEEFRKAVDLDPKYPRAHSLLGYATLEFMGESGYPAARKLFEQELTIQPKSYLTLVLLGITTVSLRDYAAAESALLRASRIRPDGAASYLYLGETYTATRRYSAAVSVLNKYVALAHNPEEFHRDLGRAYFLLGQNLLRLDKRDEAQKALARSRELREAEFKYDQEHMFYDQEHQVEASEGTESHTSERVAGTLEAGAAEDSRSTQAMAQGGLPAEGAVQHQSAPTPNESPAAKKYRRFVADTLASSYNDLGVMRAQESKFSEASSFFKRAATWKSDLPGLDRNWGLAAYRAELFQEAIPPLERHVSAQPDDAVARRVLGVCYFTADNFEKTVLVLRPLLSNPPDDPALLFAWGTALVKTHQPDTGEKILRLLLEKHSDNPSVHFLLGQAYAEQEDYPNALRELQTSLELDPKLAEAHYYMGLVYLHQSNFELAAKELYQELNLRPGDPLTSYRLAFALRSQGRVNEAAQLLLQVVKSKPDYEPAQFELGRALLEQGDTERAIASLETAEKLVPDHEATYFQLSQAYRKVGRIEDANRALANYRKLIEEARLRKRKTLERE